MAVDESVPAGRPCIPELKGLCCWRNFIEPSTRHGSGSSSGCILLIYVSLLALEVAPIFPLDQDPDLMC